MNDNIKAFKELVALKYQVFNSIFLTLDLDGVHQTGILLPLLSETCKESFAEGMSPDRIINRFFDDYEEFDNEKKRIDQLFRFIQFIERQVVLVDALEDAAFAEVNNMEGSGSFTSFYQQSSNRNAIDKLREALNNFRVRLVLTAHPTQFYPGPVLGIITDLSEAIKSNDLPAIKKFLAQLGKTPFFKKEKPSPFDEAVRLTWYLENIFYVSLPKIYKEVMQQLGADATDIIGDNTLIQLGFWPGGDRDGNPFVSTDTTMAVADRLRSALMRSYYKDIRVLKRKITFRGTEELVSEIEKKLYLASFVRPENPPMKPGWLRNRLDELRDELVKKHNGLYLEELDDLRIKVKMFGFHFASIDIRQDSRVIKKAFSELESSIFKKEPAFEDYFEVTSLKKIPIVEDAVLNDCLQVPQTIKEIQSKNGVPGSYRFIISNCRDEFDVARVFALAKASGFGEKMTLDIIPLFETINDLLSAAEVMSRLYDNKDYKKHLNHRGKKQVVMLGFSDGTKDGGYATANWSIFKAKESISKVSEEFGINVVFFDGRGGPPARGGGNTHKFYASLGPTIQSSQIQITVQGQTISSNFGTAESSQFNLEQLLTAGLENSIMEDANKMLDEDQRKLIEELSAVSYKTYSDFKAHPLFLSYLEEMSTLHYYGKTNIGSRPSKRGKSSKLVFEDLRAIPFVGAWSQLKQNVPGFYGLGSALEAFDKGGNLALISDLYRDSLFFRTLIENSMQSLSKSNFNLTAYMANDKKFGDFWTIIHEESKRTKKYLLKISGQKELLETNPSIKASISLRESIVLPLLTIQQYALIRIKELEKAGKGNTALADTLKKLVIRSLYGNINAARNSA